MKSDRSEQIAEWFEGQSDDDVNNSDRRDPFFVFGSSRPSLTLYTTKPGLVSLALDEVGIPQWLTIIGRAGLPHSTDIGWIRRLFHRSAVAFLGDLDPFDLLIYTWLRTRVRRPTITYLGVSDQFISRAAKAPTASHEIRLSNVERTALCLLRSIAADVLALVGPASLRTLDGERKLELEAIVAASGLRGNSFLNALSDAGKT